MGVEYRIDGENRLVRMTYAGRVSDDDIVTVQGRLRRDPLFRPDFRQLVDASGVTEVAVTAAGLCGAAAASAFGPGARRAMVAPTAVTRAMAGMYQKFRMNALDEVEIFGDVAEACSWLAVPAPAQERELASVAG